MRLYTVNWKKILSIKVQSVCDPNVIFEDVVAKWPRPHHDSFILQLSTLYQNFENNSFSDAWLLRDSGYPLKKWLVTPLSNPVSSPEQKYKIAHQKKTLYNWKDIWNSWKPLENFRSHRRSDLLRTSKSFEHCYDLLRSAKHSSPKWFGFLRWLWPCKWTIFYEWRSSPQSSTTI